MESIQSRVESWLREQRAKFFKVSWGPLQWRMRWPWILNDGNRQQRKRIHKEYERRRKQLHDLCAAVKADSLSDLQDMLCCMVLSECVYKRPASELVRAVNKFKADFGGQIVSLERVQPSSDHVTHRYFLAEAGKESTSGQGVGRFGRKEKLSPRYIGPFEILERIGEVAYRLALPPQLARVHNVFYVSLLRRYRPDPSHVLNWEDVNIAEDVTFDEGPIRILDSRDQGTKGKNSSFGQSSVETSWS